MSYAPPPPPLGQGPPPPPPPPPPPGQGYYYGPPMSPNAPAPHAARTSGGKLIGAFVGALVGVGVLVGIIVLASQPPPPTSCPEGQACNPDPPGTIQPDRTAPPGQQTPLATLPPLPTLPPLQTPQPTPAGQTPGPDATPVPTAVSNAPPFVAGTIWRSSSLGYSFEYDPDLWDLEREEAAFALLAINGQIRVRDQEGNIETRPVRVELTITGFPGSTSTQQAIQSVLGQADANLIGRAPNNRSYDALLGAGIGYVRGDGAVFSATVRNADGTPGVAVGLTIMASTNGQVTLVAQVLVHDPNILLGGNTLQKEVKGLADRVTKTVLWSTE